MRGMLPWGGYGANPMPENIQREISDNPGLDGMRPYSEGIYEDLNKAMVLGVLRDPSKTALDIAGDYAARYFGEATRAPVTEAVRLMEWNMDHVARVMQGEIVRDAYALDAVAPDSPWRFSHAAPLLDRERTQRVKSLLDEAEGRMTEERRTSWRFRLLRLRAEIDCALADRAEEGRLEPLFEELARIGRVSNRTPPWLVPPARSLWLRVQNLWQTCL